MKKTFPKKKINPFPASSFHISNEGGKKTLTSTPLPLNSKNKEGKKSRCTLSLVAQ
jgi:hypothetical protein